jgi:4-hydroxy-tetrahydrodipicolinate reductase
MREAPYKVVVWGPGVLGTLLLREIGKLPELELVGVLAYSEAKDGVDVGTYLGTDPVGLAMTTDKESIFALPADCVLFCTQATAGADTGSGTTKDVCRLLASGKNVVTAIGYHYPPFHGHELLDMLEAACLAGGTSLHSTGVNPGLFNERFATTLSAVCTRIDSVTVQEVGMGSTVDSVDMMRMVGWGQPPPPAPEIVEMAVRYYGESITHACALLGRSVERVEPESNYVLADRDYEVNGMVIPKDTMGCVMHKFTAIVDGRPFFRLEEYFIADPDLAPIPVPCSAHWTITIEGQPTSISASIDMQPSFVDPSRVAVPGDPPPAYYATGVPMIQAIPVVCASPPGIVYPSIFTGNVPDLRMLESLPVSPDHSRGSVT